MKTPLFIYNGDWDDHVPIKEAEMTFRYLKNEVYDK